MVMVGAQTDLAFSEYQKMWAVKAVACRGGRRDINHSVHEVPMRLTLIPITTQSMVIFINRHM